MSVQGLAPKQTAAVSFKILAQHNKGTSDLVVVFLSIQNSLYTQN